MSRLAYLSSSRDGSGRHTIYYYISDGLRLLRKRQRHAAVYDRLT